MVSSETGLVGCSVGSIVWVRRRNGSWWPGKILGPKDLSSSLITSPRSGTPVKLLGREDASVDWYNLEKSKRVKTFRCGDFDDCIERAEAAQGMPPKKREKYARREDAILHALELERHMLGSNAQKSPDAVASGSYFEGAQNVPSLSTRLLAAEKDEHHLHSQTKTIEGSSQVSGDDYDDDDYSPSALPSRMRGLQDFGLCTVPQQISGDELLSGVPFCSKRSRQAYLLQYDSGGDSSNDNRSQPSSSMMQTTPVSSKFGTGYVPNVVGEDHISESTEDDTETDFSESDSLDSDDSDDEQIGLSDGSIELQPKYPRIIDKHKENGSYISSSIDDIDGYTSADDDTSNPFPYDHPTSIAEEGSKWNLKGKRNNRMLGKRRSMDINEAATTYMTNQSAAIKRKRGEYYWEDLQQHEMDISGGRIMMQLVDVDLNVQANNYCKNVPMTSLTSMVNGHSIIGHPIQIEALESGSTDKILKAAGYISPELGPVWRTGRRTANSRVPRPRFDKKLVVGFSLNPYKKVTGQSSGQKIRTLSSIASHQKQSNDHLANVRSNCQVDGLIKTVPTAVACIPVKLVFSRLHEELVGRHQ